MTVEPEWAPWNVVEKDPSDSRFILVHNTYTNKTFRMAKRRVGKPYGTGISDKWRAFMTTEKLLVYPADIMPLLDERIDAQMNSFPANKATTVLMPTDACQLACTYCFNVDVRTEAVKTEKKRRLEPVQLARKFLAYYEDTPAQFWSMIVTGGGEPFLAASYLAKVTRIIRDRAINLGREFSIHIVTNGAAITPNKIKLLKRNGLGSLSITLDPDHDKTRPTVAGNGTFDIIMKNIMELPADIKVTINVNLATGEDGKFKKLLKRIEPIRGRISGLSPSVTTGIIDPSSAQRAAAKGYSRLNGRGEIDTVIACEDAIIDADFPIEISMPYVNCEAFEQQEPMAYNYAGETTFCAGMSNLPEYEISNMSEEKARSKFDMRQVNPAWKKFCFTDGEMCAYLPKCFGGCRHISVTAGHGWGTINCEFPLFDRLTRRNLTLWAE